MLAPKYFWQMLLRYLRIGCIRGQLPSDEDAILCRLGLLVSADTQLPLPQA